LRRKGIYGKRHSLRHKKNKTKRDLALIFSVVPASAASVYTQNLVKGAPLIVTKTNIADGKAQL
jgi:glutamate N-acetyltransferase/amino-acid N-acetyltransferase